MDNRWVAFDCMRRPRPAWECTSGNSCVGVRKSVGVIQLVGESTTSFECVVGVDTCMRRPSAAVAGACVGPPCTHVDALVAVERHFIVD